MDQKTPTAADQPDKLQGIRFLGDLQRLELKPDDVLVLTVDEILSERAAERIREAMTLAFGESRKVFVLSAGMRLGAIECQRR